MEKNALKELEKFQLDREINKQEFNIRIATMNVMEELLEAHGIGDNKDRKLSKIMYQSMLNLVDTVKGDEQFSRDMGYTFEEPTIEGMVDAFCDVQVFAGGEITKLGYSNEKCLLEVGKEINSRTGEMVNGKFEKFKTEEAMAKWYKADFSGCKLRI